MRYDELTEGLAGVRLNTGNLPEISGIAFDSRKVTANSLFVCLIGSRADGHRFIPQALARGAVAIVADAASTVSLTSLDIDAKVPILVTPDSRQALALLANRFFKRPFERLLSIAITGTNGKTTTAFLVESILTRAGRRCALFGTIFFRLGRWEIHGQNTTPESLDLYELLSSYIEEGADSVVLEASSHGLMSNRLDQASFDAAVFTNLSPEHLDFHGDMERYYQAKKTLFTRHLPLSRAAGKAGVALVNVDDPYGRRLLGEIEGPRLGYGLDPSAEIRATDLSLTRSGSHFMLRLPGVTPFDVHLPLIGRHNVYNALAAASAAHACSIDPVHIREGCAALTAVPGRLEPVLTRDGQGPEDEQKPAGDRGPMVYVDFAHTPVALHNALKALRDLMPASLWVVFGCGGDRDTTKRTPMGSVAGGLADVAVVTSDNPRSEDPMAIIAAIEQGLAGTGRERLNELAPDARGYLVQPDRRLAIHQAILAAPADAIVLLAGKGHESTQEVQGQKTAFDDRQVARETLSLRRVTRRSEG